MASDDDAPRSQAQEVCWLAIFGANLVVPLSLGWSFTERDSWVGMVAGVAAMLAVWQFVIPRFAALRSALLPGGVVLALSQLLPVLQFFAGVFATAVVGLDGADRPGVFDNVTALAITVVTGVQLWLVAVLVGFVLRGMGRQFRSAKAGATESAK